MFRITIAVILLLGAGTPTMADQNWRSLLTDQGYLQDQRNDRAGLPDLAPPVKVEPMFGIRRGRMTLPNACLQSVETRDGWLRIYDRDCLADRRDELEPLPRFCSVRLETWGAIRRGYDAQCLFDDGFKRTR